MGEFGGYEKRSACGLQEPKPRRLRDQRALGAANVFRVIKHARDASQ